MNPFKKKENEFKLDEHSLPSLSDSSSNELGSNPFAQESDSNNVSMPKNPFDESNNDMSDSYEEPKVNPMDLSSTPSNFSGSNNSQKEPNFDAQNYHNEISRTKIDSVDAKLSLVEARMSNINNKLDLILEILDAEISPETKRKLKIENMMSSIKKQ